MKKKLEIRDIAIIGLLTALQIVSKMYLSIYLTDTIRLTFNTAFTILTGIWFGPVAGAIEGIAADLVGWLVKPQGAIAPLVTSAAALWGILGGLLAPVYHKCKGAVGILGWIGLTAGIVLVTSQFYNTWALSVSYGTPFWANFTSRLFQLPFTMIFTTTVVYVLYHSPVTGLIYQDLREPGRAKA